MDELCKLPQGNGGASLVLLLQMMGPIHIMESMATDVQDDLAAYDSRRFLHESIVRQ